MLSCHTSAVGKVLLCHSRAQRPIKQLQILIASNHRKSVQFAFCVTSFRPCKSSVRSRSSHDRRPTRPCASLCRSPTRRHSVLMLASPVSAGLRPDRSRRHPYGCQRRSLERIGCRISSASGSKPAQKCSKQRGFRWFSACQVALHL